jgi:hypothetical protein
MRRSSITALIVGLATLASYGALFMSSNHEPPRPRAKKDPATAPAAIAKAVEAPAPVVVKPVEAPVPKEIVAAPPLFTVDREPTTENLARDTRERPNPLDSDELLIRAQERQMLNVRWETQSTDPQWSSSASIKIEDLLATSNFDPYALSEVDCRKTICRFVLSGQDSRDAVDLIHVARDLHDETWLDHHEQADGTWQIEVFFSRPGYMLSGSGERIPDPS